MRDILKNQLGVYSNFPISLVDLSLSLLVALFLGLLLMMVRRHISVSSTYDSSFDFTLIFMPSIVALIMIFIGSNLTLSIGLVGSLSVIRFRTVIKNSSDMFFLFWVVSVGLGCGTFNIVQVIYASFFITIMILLINRFYLSNKKNSNISEALLIVNCDKKISNNLISKILNKYKIIFKVRSIEYQDLAAEYCFNLMNSNSNLNQSNIEKIIEDLNDDINIKNVSFISPEIKLDI